MGVQISSIIPKKEIEFEDLSGKRIAIDTYNTLYQFLSIIRDRFTGESLKDSKGRVTSHLSGLFYRTANMLEFGIKPIFVFDGKPPEFKWKTIEERKKAKEEAKKKMEEAIAKGEAAIKYAQATSQLTKDMVDESKKLLEYMGVPWVQAPSEGEGQCSYMCREKKVWASGSQDGDSLLFGSPRLVKNLTISGRRKLPKKETYIEINPEIIELEKVLETLGINRDQLIILGILIGTDFNPGVYRVGPKTALKLVKEHKTLHSVLENVDWNDQADADEIFEFFKNPPATDEYDIEFKPPQKDKIIEFMVEEHDFSRERTEKSLDRIISTKKTGSQPSLSGWLKK